MNEVSTVNKEEIKVEKEISKVKNKGRSSVAGLAVILGAFLYYGPLGQPVLPFAASAPSQEDPAGSEIVPLQVAVDTPDPLGSGIVPTEVVVAEDPVNWTFVQLARYFDAVTIDGVRWVLPRGTWFSTDKSNDRYEAHETTDDLGGDFGWCSATTRWQPDCPPWVGLYHADVTDGVSAIMDIATRIRITGEDGGQFHLMWQFNDVLREGTEKSLMDDYLTAASQGQLGLFIATADPSMMPGTLYLDQEYTFGYGCWDCLADTSGRDDNIVSLDDESIGHMGPDTPSLGDSLWPAYVIPIPSPDNVPDFMVDLTVKFPKGTNVVIWFGRYDFPGQ